MQNREIILALGRYAEEIRSLGRRLKVDPEGIWLSWRGYEFTHSVSIAGTQEGGPRLELVCAGIVYPDWGTASTPVDVVSGSPSLHISDGIWKPSQWSVHTNKIPSSAEISVTEISAEDSTEMQSLFLSLLSFQSHAEPTLGLREVEILCSKSGSAGEKKFLIPSNKSREASDWYNSQSLGWRFYDAMQRTTKAQTDALGDHGLFPTTLDNSWL